MEALFNAGMSLFASAEGGEAHGSIWGLVFYLVLILGLIFGVLAYSKKGLTAKVFKNPLTACGEQLYLFIENMCVGTIGAHGRKYIPMIFTFWLVIFFSNLVGLFFPETLTAILSFNVGMALISIGYVQFEGMRSNGVLGHFKHFAGPKLAGVMALIITPIIFSIEIVSELMKNVSLSLRLFGNIHGGHQAVEAMNAMGAKYYIPFGEFLLPIKLLTVIVQALIFCLLTCVYLSLVTHHEEDHGHEGGHGELAPAH